MMEGDIEIGENVSVEVAANGDMRARVQFAVGVSAWERRLIRQHLTKTVSPELADVTQVREFFRRYGQQVGEQMLRALEIKWQTLLEDELPPPAAAAAAS